MRRKNRNWLLGLFCLFAALPVQGQIGFDVQAHRGGRALWPENTLETFKNAIALGVDTLEFDLACTADDVPVVSHDPYLSWKLVRDKDGDFLDKSQKLLIKDLTLSNLAEFSIGEINRRSDYYFAFRSQTPIPAQRIPSLTEVFELTEGLNPSIRYNIEIKTYPPFPEYTRNYSDFAKLVIDIVREYKLENRVTIQSFDWRVLSYVGKIAPEIRIACLCVKDFALNGEAYNLQLGIPGASEWLAGLDADDYPSIPALVAAFGGDIYSPYYKDIQPADIAEAHRLGLEVVPWTVNKQQTMRELIDLGVDGIITDRPDLLLKETGS